VVLKLLLLAITAFSQMPQEPRVRIAISAPTIWVLDYLVTDDVFSLGGSVLSNRKETIPLNGDCIHYKSNTSFEEIEVRSCPIVSKEKLNVKISGHPVSNRGAINLNDATPVTIEVTLPKIKTKYLVLVKKPRAKISDAYIKDGKNKYLIACATVE
jgi:hypothetical protein